MSKKPTSVSGQRALARADIARALKTVKRAATHMNLALDAIPPWVTLPCEHEFAAGYIRDARRSLEQAEHWLAHWTGRALDAPGCPRCHSTNIETDTGTSEATNARCLDCTADWAL